MTNDELKMLQALPLDIKVEKSKVRIMEWFGEWSGMVYVAFSGGKDSIVMLHLVRSMLPSVPAVFCDTGLEFPEIRQFVKSIDNTTWLKPKMRFDEVIRRYGYPIVSKEVAHLIYQARHTKSDYLKNVRLNGKGPNKIGKIPEKWKYLLHAPFEVSARCCDVMKKAPMQQYFRREHRYPFIGVKAGDSRMRRRRYLKYGCNIFGERYPQSNPIGFWRDEDIWAYIRENDLKYCNVYDMGYEVTGCVFCAFGCHMENGEDRFNRLSRTHPALWRYCMDTLGMREVFRWYPCGHQLMLT